MKTQLYIPKKINVGYQERYGTYTGKLAFIIYWDDKGVLRKQTSWESWRDQNIDNTEIENVPTEGFVLNKGVGGQRESWGWNARNEYIRVYDPRGFEFEISVANLLFILQECTSTKGKGLEGEFVYSWNGKELVLLPVTSQEYIKSTEFTSLQSKKVTRTDMTPGCSYTCKKGEELLYIGRFPFYNMDLSRNSDWSYELSTVKTHVFLNLNFDESKDVGYGNQKYIVHKGFTKLASKKTETPVENYADLLEEFNNSQYGNPPNKFKYEPTDIDMKDIGRWGGKSYFIGNENEAFKFRFIEEWARRSYFTNRGNSEPKLLGYKVELYNNYEIKDNSLKVKYTKYGQINLPSAYKGVLSKEQLLNLKVFKLKVQMVSGQITKIKSYIR